MFKKLLAIALMTVLVSCNSSDVEDALDLIDEPDRKAIPVNLMGVNAFVNDSRFGTIEQQFDDISSNLDLRFARVLFAWGDNVHATPNGEIDFSFYDAILAGMPARMDALVVLASMPSWMRTPANWIDGNPRTTFVEKWVKPIVRRYRNNPRVVGFQIWNEPNAEGLSDNIVMDVVGKPDNYVEMLARAFDTMRDSAPTKLVVSASTTTITQDYPRTLNYNRGMRDAGVTRFCDVYAIHYYGKNYENVVRDGGVEDYLKSINLPIWVTESGIVGVNRQREYVERTWPFLREKIPQIERFYYYEYAASTALPESFGLRNLSATLPVSDLYVYLRDRS